jgi:hypothetical protein
VGFTFNAMSMNMKCKIEECARVGFALELGIDSIILNNQFIKLSRKCFSYVVNVCAFFLILAFSFMVACCFR